MTDETAELDLLIEHRERTAAFLAAKEAAQTGGEEAQETWRAAKAQMREWRAFWRSLREPTPGTASPDTAGLKARSE